jgi:hypothetical protein
MEWGSDFVLFVFEGVKERGFKLTEAFPKVSQHPLPMQYKNVAATIPFPEISAYLYSQKSDTAFSGRNKTAEFAKRILLFSF